MSRPVIGISTAVEQARWGPWDEPAMLLPRTYSDAIARAGGIPVMLSPHALAAGEAERLLGALDALVLAGGADIDPPTYGAEPHPATVRTRPERDRFELELARQGLERDLPLLGICRGMQALNVARGGTLAQHLPDLLDGERHQRLPGEFAHHEVWLEPGSLAARTVGAERVWVRSHHHQGIAELGEGLVASAWSVGDDLVEAIELPGPGFALGVLWHPEEDPADRLIPAFVSRL
jgi:putative glutamine amidotransferase